MIKSAFSRYPDSFQLAVYAHEAALEIGLFEPFLALLNVTDAAPEWISINRKRQAFSTATLRSIFTKHAGAAHLVFMLGRDSSPDVSFTVAVYPGATDGRGLALSSRLPWDYLTSGGRAAVFAERLGHALGPFCPMYGRCHSLADLVEINRGKPRSSDWEPVSIDEVFWLNWYGKELVDRIGRERVMSVPAHALYPQPDGSVLWTSSASPADVDSEAARIAQARARAHLVDGVSFDAELARLRQRSERLALVEPTWSSEVDPVFSRITRVHPPEQSQLVARLNALDIPAVSEWRPAAEVATDVEDPGQAIEELGMHAEQLIALVHDHVERIGELTLEVVPELDAHLWQRNYAETAPREAVDGDLVPALGAYIGDLLVRRLGGRWVPRAALDESAVVVGERAWLPFERARKCLATRDGALRFSMTQLVNAVQRSG